MNNRRRDEIERDIREHLEMETRENMERGMPEAAARAAALRKFGNPARVAEDTRAVWQWQWAERMAQDIRYAVRGLRRNPVFAAVAILTLALGIGMNTAVFSVVNAVLLKPLAYPHPERILWLATYDPNFHAEIASDADYLDWREQSQSYDRMACYDYDEHSMVFGDNAVRAAVAEVSADFWPIAGVRPAAGRLPVEGDRDVIVLTWGLFQREFRGDASVVGRNVILDGAPATVVGVLPADFRFLLPLPQRPNDLPRQIEAYIPSEITRATAGGGRFILKVVARLKPGIALGQARRELQGIQDRRARQTRTFMVRRVLHVLPAQEELVGNARPALFILSGAVAFVLSIACANIAGLLLARSAARRREVAIRAAMGAGQLRMIAQFLEEGLVLALAGGAAGLLLARGAIAVLMGFGPRAVPRLEGAAIDGRVLGFTLLVSLLSGLLFGLGPAISLARANLHDELKAGARTFSIGMGPRLRTLLVAGELAVALVLLTGAGLMVKSLWHMNARPPGFHPESVLVAPVALSGPTYREVSRQTAYFEEALRRVRDLPGVESAGLIFSPVRGVVQVEGAPPFTPGRLPRAVFYAASSGYFRAMGIRLIAGRWITDNEPSGAVLVNESFVRELLGGGPGIGRRVNVPDRGTGHLSEIAGVVSDVRYSRLDADPGPEVYFPYLQSFFQGRYDVVVRASGDALALAPAVHSRIAGIDRTLPAPTVRTLEAALAETVAPRRFNLLLLETFAASALLLALIGIYGVMSYAVAQRTREIGVRMALGARRAAIVRLVVGQGMAMALGGVAAGMAAAYWLTRLMATLLFEVKPDDPATFAAVAVVLTAAALAACWLPALRAARVDPLVTLRYE